MVRALSPGGACSDFCFKGKEHPRSLESSGDSLSASARLGFSLGASLGGFQGAKSFPRQGGRSWIQLRGWRSCLALGRLWLFWVVLRAGHSWDPETREALLFLWLCGFSSFILQLVFTVPTKILYLGSLWHHNYTRIAESLGSLCF